MTGAPSSPTSSKPVLAAIASAIIPGVGQFIAGDRRKGSVLLAVDAILMILLFVFFGDEIAFAKLWLQPSSLALMMIGNIALLGYRIWAADDAYRTARAKLPAGTRPSGTTMVLAGFGLALLLLVPHAVFGYYDVIQYDLITTVFGSSSSTTTSPPVTSPPVTTETGETVPTTATSSTTVPTSSGFLGDERMNILLIGGDFGVGRTGIRTDTMITVSIDPTTGETAMFSVPRNWTQVPLPEGMGIWDCGYTCYPELINELWVAGENYPEAFPGPGTPSENAVKGVISEFLGIPIHYYAMVNLVGFVDIVDALGGVTIDIPSRVVDEEYPNEDGVTTERIVIEPGLQTLDGHLALAYARTRNQDSDYFRMNRQRCVIEAMVEQADPIDLLRNFQTLANVIKDTMITDIPIDALPELLELKPLIDLENIVSVRFIPPDYHLKFRDDGEPGRVPNIELVHEHVDLVISDPQRAITELGLERLEDACS